jgi:hypothetical protein
VRNPRWQDAPSNQSHRGWNAEQEQLDLQRIRAEDLVAAENLARSLREGWRPTPISDPALVLERGEQLFARAGVDVHVFTAQDVQHSPGWLIGFGGPLLFAATLAGSALLGVKRRIDAERQASPQWRPYGGGVMYVTDRRLALAAQRGITDIPYYDIRTLDSDGDGILVMVREWPALKLRVWQPHTNLLLIRFLMRGEAGNTRSAQA